MMENQYSPYPDSVSRNLLVNNKFRVKKFRSTMEGSTTLCQFDKYGLCRYRQVCRHQHVQDGCENKNCAVKRCQICHPKVCTFFRKSQRCKFGVDCLYRHEPEQFLSQRMMIRLKYNQKLKAQRKKIKSLGKVIEANSNTLADGGTYMTQLR